ncbi:hypothetical protein [Natrinema halophilum]|uniref:Uncharacterized protein n=1 Tax=Natrinema halophilum TaxID=1699371 RepID=A0A7D5K7H8_9EURY|nr:hypothetical protein [Natrinema halophilum]QLG50003.1 hypothetical protein HYG82_14630 [Natrinema halophilum]
MNPPRSRRAFLASFATTAAVATGGFQRSASNGEALSLDSGLVPADRYECSAITRPTPLAPAAEDALEPRTYPTPPAELISDDNRGSIDRPSSLQNSALEYATKFERAYRQNAFLTKYGSVTRFFALQRTASQTSLIDSSNAAHAVLVAIVYNLTKQTQQSPPSDEWDIRATYYFDDRIALRAQYDGIAEKPTLSPDPRRDGELVACFGYRYR